MRTSTALLVLLALLVVASIAMATSPELPRISVEPADQMQGIVLAPGHPSPMPASVQVITIRDADNVPLADLLVEFLFSSGITTCPDAVLTGITDSNGRVVITPTGTGCADNVAPYACRIRAAGIPIREYRNVKSPDLDGNLRVDLADLVIFLSGPIPCADFDNDGDRDLVDVTMFVSAYRNYCP